MRILITGISGQVGSALLAKLTNHDVIGADRTILDLSKPNGLMPALDNIRPEVVINCAAYTAVDQAEEERDLAKTVNGTAPSVIARWSKDNGAILIHFSTDYVFDGSGSAPWSEEDATRPLSWYGRTKEEGEQAILQSGASALVLRTSWVYSAMGRSFLRSIARLASEREEISIVSDQNGAPTSACLIASNCTQMLDCNFNALQTRCCDAKGLVHLCASGETSWYGFAVSIVEGLRARGVHLALKRIFAIPTAEYPTAAKRPANSRLSLRRLERVFGLQPEHWNSSLQSELDKLSQENHLPARA